MSKETNATVFAAIIAAAVPAAYAQTRTVPDTRVAVTHSMIQPDEVRASKLIGTSVYDVQNRNIGSVKDIVLARSGAVDAVVVDVGSFLGMGGKYVPCDWRHQTDGSRLTLDRTRNNCSRWRYRLENPDKGAGTSPSPATGGSLGR